MELHFDELPSGELEVILHQRCSLPPSYCTKLVQVMQDLQVSANLQGRCVVSQLAGFDRSCDLWDVCSSPCAGDRLCLRGNTASLPSGTCSAGQTAIGWRNRLRRRGIGCSIWLTMVTPDIYRNVDETDSSGGGKN